MPLWIIVTALVVLALYVFVWPFALAQITGRLSQDEPIEVFAQSLEDLFDNFGGRVGHFLMLVGLAGIAFLAWAYFKS